MSYGVEWFFRNNNVDAGTKTSTGVLDLGSAGITALAPGFSYTIVDSADQVRLALNLLATESDINVLSSPSLMVLDNQTATINVGVPGPQVRSRCQDPVLLEDVLIDFPGLTVIGAHMGHPYEALLIQYMLKWPKLHLMTSAYLATYMDPALVRFMDSSRGRGRVLFASDHPVIPAGKALDAARKLPLSDEGMALFLGGAAQNLLAGRPGIA